MCTRESSKHTTGQAMVEFALAFTIVLVLVFGIMESGRLLFIYGSVVTATREASRYGSAVGYETGVVNYQDCAGIRDAALRVASISGLVGNDFNPSLPNEQGIHIAYDNGPGTGVLAICDPAHPYTAQLGNRVVVTTRYFYQPILPLLGIEKFTISYSSARTIVKEVDVNKIQ